jgi:fatty acyl-CoA reductase
VLKRECPESLKKLVPVSGDCMELGLGLSPSDRQMLEEKVSIVFHSAASVRFDDTLTYATIMNTRGTREVMLLARNMKNLKVGLINLKNKSRSLVFPHYCIALYLKSRRKFYRFFTCMWSTQPRRPQSTSSLP